MFEMNLSTLLLMADIIELHITIRSVLFSSTDVLHGNRM